MARRTYAIITLALLFLVPALITFSNAEQMQCGNMKWGDKAHDDNTPSSKEFKKAAYTKSLCELAKGIDHEIYSNHDSVNWKQFQKSIAFTEATDEQQDCMTKSHKEGTGMKGLGGYEILYCATDED